MKSQRWARTAGGGLWRPTGGRRSETGLLLLDGGDRFRGCVVQVLRCCDGQAALRQDPLGLVHIGSWQEKETVTAARPGGAKGSAEMGEKKMACKAGFLRRAPRPGRQRSPTNHSAGAAAGERLQSLTYGRAGGGREGETAAPRCQDN